MGYGYSVADGARTVMAEPYDGLDLYSDYENEWEAQDDYSCAWDELLYTVQDCLTPKWRRLTLSGRKDAVWRRGHPGGRVLAESKLHEVLVEEDPGGYGYAFISVVPRPDIADAHRGLAEHTLHTVADAIFQKLQKTYDLRVPGGYVSSAYQPRTTTKAAVPAAA